MAKTLGQALYGLSLEVKKKIREEIKSAQSARAQEGGQEQEAHWEGLSALAKSVQDLVDKAKANGSVPKGIIIDKLSKIPASKPKRWNALYKKLFSRKFRTAKPAGASAPLRKKTLRKTTASKKA